MSILSSTPWGHLGLDLWDNACLRVRSIRIRIKPFLFNILGKTLMTGAEGSNKVEGTLRGDTRKKDWRTARGAAAALSP